MNNTQDTPEIEKVSNTDAPDNYAAISINGEIYPIHMHVKTYIDGLKKSNETVMGLLMRLRSTIGQSLYSDRHLTSLDIDSEESSSFEDSAWNFHLQ